MQPQGPQNQPGGQYNPYQNGPGSATGGQPQPSYPRPAAPGQPQGYGPAPGQQIQPGQMGMPQTGNAGQPPIPQYQMPKNLQNAGNPNGPSNPNLAPPPDAASTPYDFFMQQPKPATSNTPLPVTGKRLGNIPGTFKEEKTGLAKKFPLIIGGGIGLVLILVLATAFAPKDQTGVQLFGVVQSQQEVMRVCELGTTKSKYRSTRNFAITCLTGVRTNQTDLLSYMQNQRLTYDAKQIGARFSAETDAALKSATASSTYDDTFRSIMQDYLDSYNTKLTAQLGITTGANAREILTESQKTAELLAQMVRDDSDKTEAPVEQ